MSMIIIIITFDSEKVGLSTLFMFICSSIILCMWAVYAGSGHQRISAIHFLAVYRKKTVECVYSAMLIVFSCFGFTSCFSLCCQYQCWWLTGKIFSKVIMMCWWG